jgi:rSAM/selenodomain-associated transferase 1
VHGRVKRRIAKDLGDAAAFAAHVHLVERTLERCAVEGDYTVELSIGDGDLDDPLVQRWRNSFGIKLTHQVGPELGSRMAHALSESLAAGEIPVLIGSDCPAIDHDYVMGAFRQLEEVDVVLGPAQDGGYGLIGLKRVVRALFNDMPWGSNQVLEVTLERAQSAGLRVAQLESIQDVDTGSDWRNYTAARG